MTLEGFVELNWPEQTSGHPDQWIVETKKEFDIPPDVGLTGKMCWYLNTDHEIRLAYSYRKGHKMIQSGLFESEAEALIAIQIYYILHEQEELFDKTFTIKNKPDDISSQPLFDD